MGAVVADRTFPPAPADPPSPAFEETWAAADLRYRRWKGRGQWQTRDDGPLPEAWTMRHAELTFELRPTDSGQVGFFGDQLENWAWLRERVAERVAEDRPPAVLNLFAYTGGATLVAAAAGAEVTHVDAARAAVAWARRNAERSRLGQAPIRWIDDDALEFVGREVRRGRRYAGIVLDPPSYGHGRGGRRWQLDDHLPVLLRACAELLRGVERPFLLLSAHSTGIEGDPLAAVVRGALEPVVGPGVGSAAAEPMVVRASSGRTARAGWAVRWSSGAR